MKIKLDKKNLIIMAATIAMLGAGAVSYFMFWNTPERVLSQMLEKNVESVHFEGETEIGRKVLGVGTTVAVGLNGNLDIKNEAMPLLETALNLKAGQGGINVLSNGELKLVGDKVYFKLSDLPDLSAFGLDFSKLEGQWIAQEVPGNQTKELTETQIKEINELTGKTKFFKEIKSIGTNNIQGVLTYHYKVKLSKDALYDYVVKTSEISAKNLSGDEKEVLKKSIEQVVGMDVELWVGKKDKMLYKISLNGNFGSASGEIKLKLALIFSKHNQKVEIAAPKDAKTLDEILKELGEKAIPTIPEQFGF